MNKRDQIAKAAESTGRRGEHNYLDEPDTDATPMEVMTEEQFQRMAGQEGIKSALLVAMASMLESDGFIPNTIEFAPDARNENLEIKISGTIMVSKDELALVLGQPRPEGEVAAPSVGTNESNEDE